MESQIAEGRIKQTEDFLEEKYPELFKENIDGSILLARAYAQRAWEAAFAVKQKEVDLIREKYLILEKQREFLINNAVVGTYSSADSPLQKKISLLVSLECSSETFEFFEQANMSFNGLSKAEVVKHFLNQMTTINKDA